MTPQEFVDWGRRIADNRAQFASRLDLHSYEYDAESAAAYEFLSKSNEVARAFTIPGAQEKLAHVPLLARLQSNDPILSQDGDAIFDQVFHALEPVLTEMLEGMWLGDWQFNDSGLGGLLKIDRASAAGPAPFQAQYIDSRGTRHETEVTRDDEEYGMSYESLHIEVKYGSYPAWKIHAFIFRWDRQTMGGIVDNGETEGRHSFYAVKKISAVPPPVPPSISGSW